MITGILVGAAAMFTVSMIAICWADPDTARELGELLLGTLAAPALVAAVGLRSIGWFKAGTLDPRTLERFARMRRADGSKAWVLAYRRHGIIWVCSLREGEEAPPRRVLTHAEVFGRGYTTVKRAN